ncbi:MAG: hypothetical protein K0R28_5672 [Paenibacillus sp.]|jgi:hypothetical protein|nr:hypothetical protein [Paenibacillus sp.]
MGRASRFFGSHDLVCMDDEQQVEEVAEQEISTIRPIFT